MALDTNKLEVLSPTEPDFRRAEKLHELAFGTVIAVTAANYQEIRGRLVLAAHKRQDELGIHMVDGFFPLDEETPDFSGKALTRVWAELESGE